MLLVRFFRWLELQGTSLAFMAVTFLTGIGAAFFIPTIWAELARIATPDYGYYWLPSIPYMFGFLIAGILCMTVIILIKVKKIEFNWENEDI